MRFTPMSAIKRRRNEVALASALLAMGVMPAAAQQANCTPGSACSTITIDGKQLPPPPQKFEGVIKETYLDSMPWWPGRVVPPKGAPNVLLVLVDDAGFGVTSTFGGVIPTPNFDRLAAMGLRYTEMHNAALCSPTRAALITGRNHHSVGYGMIAELATGYPGYDGIIPKNKVTIGRILQDNGYATSWFGKDHNTPPWVTSVAGPYDLWPSGYGFQYFYGFPVGETDQWTPYLFRNHTAIYPWVGKPPGTWNLMTAMADDAIGWLQELNATQPDTPFLLYYAPGATHAPHHPTKEWIDKIGAMHLFDGGWNKLRETIFANEKRLGVIPQDAKLTPWPSGPPAELPMWDSLSAEDKKMYIKQADVFGAYTAYCDNEIGRVVAEIEKEGKLDNTLNRLCRIPLNQPSLLPRLRRPHQHSKPIT